MKILLISANAEDKSFLTCYFETHFPAAGIRTVQSGEEALSELSAERFDAVFLSPDRIGGQIRDYAEKLRRMQPFLSMIFLADDDRFAMSALNASANGYLLRPLREEDLNALRSNFAGNIPEAASGLYIQCFGRFEVFFDGRSLSFSRSKAKEVLAYLIALKGAAATANEICAALWKQPPSYFYGKNKDNFHHIYGSLRTALAGCGQEEILVRNTQMYSIIPSKINCDFYEFLQRPRHGYRGPFMEQYDWAKDYDIFSDSSRPAPLMRKSYR